MEETMEQELFRIIASYDCSIVLNSIDDNIISNWAGKLDKDAFVKEYKISTKNKTRYTHKRFNQTNVGYLQTLPGSKKKNLPCCGRKSYRI